MRGGVDRGHDRAGRVPPRPPALIAVALVGVLGIVVLLVFGFSLGAWWAVGSPALGRHSDGLDTFLEAFRIVLSVVAGLGGVVALVMVYRRQRFGEIADHRADLPNSGRTPGCCTSGSDRPWSSSATTIRPSGWAACTP